MEINNQDIKILIVDDQPNNLHVLSSLLIKSGYKVQRSISGSMVVNAELAALPDLILLDIMMPDLDGYEVCKRLKAREKTRDIPVIFLSALNEAFDKVKAFTIGGVDYISKPFQVEEVLARIENQLTIQQLSKQLKEQNTQLQQEIEVRKQAEECLRQSEARERKKSQELERTLNELKRTQVQLIHSEKMSSLGQMVAGVAHEINNPVNFIYGNLYIVRQYIQDLIGLIELYQENCPELIPIIQERIEQIELEYLVEDWSKLVDSMETGAERIHQIVRSLQIFSKLNESEIKSVDIHENIDRTLKVLNHRLVGEGCRDEIKIIKDYGELPKVTCYISQLNQVFMNLLNNAIDVLAKSPSTGVIRISTSMGRREDGEIEEQFGVSTSDLPPNPYVIIRIADNGTGISEDVLKRIFDPFFTTKPVGSGRGLGLSISYQIVVEKHGGEMRCNSAIGKGTEFAIKLPIVPSKISIATTNTQCAIMHV
ncbi:hybrid sensor histidine kinase/response regulator [Limnofasciculus baicalensis]|uniref:histidine kinase n=1 Tax=Limnofasciculus baicalensis BBK-W-15 TaxID=2699891 RepID=A0AAE3GR93_9CYAN|nr:response regulator [Limnofasciculus baicalensis]MCP2728393.1 response regulator [Limnofasciculus baicalensis BBK-W-15]